MQPVSPHTELRRLALLGRDDLYQQLNTSPNGLSDSACTHPHLSRKNRKSTFAARLSRAFFTPFNFILMALAVVSWLTTVVWPSNETKTGISALLSYIYIRVRFPMFHLSKDDWRLDPRLCVRLMRIGIPGAVQFSVCAIGVIIVAVSANLRFSLSIAGGLATASLSFCGLTFPAIGMYPPIAALAKLFPFTYYIDLFIEQSLRGAPPARSLGDLAAMGAFVLVMALLVPRLRKVALNPRYYGKE